VKYIGRRLVHAILLILAISFLSFGLAQLAPGDFFDALRLNPQISAQSIDHLRAEYGLDRPFLVRYARWLQSMARGEMGLSLAYNSPVGPLLLARARNTLLLAGCALTLAWLLAVPLGVYSAAKRGAWPDRTAELTASAILTVPDLFVFLVLLLLAVRTGWFPIGGMASLGANGLNATARLADMFRHLALPCVGLALATFPVLFRHVRTALIETLQSPFLRAARGHGISERRLLFRYALPAAANPLISLLGFSVASMLSMSLLVEVIFSWPGIGPLLLESIMARDVYVVVAAVVFSSTFLIAGNLLADLLIFATDPRIRVDQSS
jgi:peptide/nickel transport system permease protein